MIKLYTPTQDDLWFRKELLENEQTMSYNHHWGGTISFPKENWKDWFDYWVNNTDNKRFYAYVLNENDEFVGEIAYHYDEELEGHIANVIIHNKYRHQGYGGEALDVLCAIAKDNGLVSIYDDMAKDNPAYQLFIKHGFHEMFRNEDIIMLKKEL